MKKTKIDLKGTTKAGREIIAALMEIKDALDAGVPLAERFTVREVVVPDAGEYKPKAIKALREKLGVSQRLFAHLMGVSTILVQAWEQGRRVPNPMARRLLDEISRDPKRWIAMMEPARAA